MVMISWALIFIIRLRPPLRKSIAKIVAFQFVVFYVITVQFISLHYIVLQLIKYCYTHFNSPFIPVHHVTLHHIIHYITYQTHYAFITVYNYNEQPQSDERSFH